MAPLDLEVLTPDRPLVRARAESVTATGAQGTLQILPAHAPCLACLEPGALSWEGREAGRLVVDGGVLKVIEDRVVILAPGAARPEELDAAVLEREFQQAEARLAEVEPSDPARVALERRVAVLRARRDLAE